MAHSAPRRILRIAQHVLAESESNHFDFLASDTQGSVIHSSSETCTGHVCYMPYGHSALCDLADPRSRYTGEALDLVSCQYHLGAGYRAYAPQLMRFTAPDDASPFGRGGINAYAYCEGDPINRMDPSGRFFQWVKRPFISSRPKFGTISKLITGKNALPQLAKELPLQNFNPPNYNAVVAKHGNPFEPAPAYTSIPYQGQLTKSINLGVNLTPISLEEATLQRSRLRAKKEYMLPRIANDKNPELKKMRDILAIDREILIIEHRRVLAIRQAESSTSS